MIYPNSFRKRPSRLSTPVRLGAAAVAACFIAVPAQSNPVNPTVVNGAATFNQVGNVLTVTNSNGAIINWDKFSIKAGETTHFAQTSASSSVLNRVLNDPTAIYGTLSSNGRVFLVNPAGIMVGAGGRVDVAGFVASTLNISNADFLAGRNLFVNDGTAKNIDIEKTAQITTPAGGSVYLIGSNVANEGIITTPKGETILAAGNTVSLIDSALPGVKVDITGAEGNATNLGTIVAEAGRVGIAGAIVRNSGVLNASSVVEEGGRIFLRASKDAYVDGNGRIVTTGAKGGQVEVLGNRVAVMDNASIDASGENGGGRIMIGGDYQGKNPDVQNSQITYFGSGASLKADATKVGDGGTVIVWADDTTRAYGNISARGGALGGNGGFVEVSGHRYLDFHASVDRRAPKGKAGLLLLDPSDIEIGNTDAFYGGTFYDSGYGAAPFYFAGATTNTSKISWATIGSQLYGGDVAITTTGSGGSGDITVSASPYGGVGLNVGHTGENSWSNSYNGIGYTSNNRLSLLAHRAINVNASFGNAGNGDIVLMAGWDDTSGVVTPNIVSYSAGKNITINGGAVIVQQGPGGLVMKAADSINILASGSGSAGIDMNAGALGMFARNSITLRAADGAQNRAFIQTNGNQVFALSGEGTDNPVAGTMNTLSLLGADGTGAYGGQARIEQFGAYGGQTFNFDNGAHLLVRAGDGDGYVPAGQWSGNCYGGGCSGNSAGIDDWGAGQTFNFYGGTLKLYGGGAGADNHASINAHAGNQTVNGNAAITLTGGSGGGTQDRENGADIGLGKNNTTGSQTVYAGSITINGGATSGFGGAGFGNEHGRPQSFYVTGDLNMTGGNSNDADFRATAAYIGSEYGGGTINIHVGGDINLNGGTAAVYGGTVAGGVMIGSLSNQYGSTAVNLSAGGSITATGNTGGVWLGVKTLDPAGVYGGSSVTMRSGWNGVNSMPSSYGGDVVLTGPVHIQTDGGSGGVHIIAEESSAGSYGGISVGSDTTVYGNYIEVVAAGDNTIAGTLNSTGNVYLDAGWSDYYSNRSQRGGDLTLAATSVVQAGGSVDMRAETGATSYGGGNIIQQYGQYGGILSADGSVWMNAERDLTINGSVTSSNSYISLRAGISCPDGCYSSTYGGNLGIGSTGILSAYGGIALEASKDISIDGSVASTTNDIWIAAGGYRGSMGDPFGYWSSPFGGNVSIGGNIRAYGGSVNILANVGYGTYGNGNITQYGGSTITGNNDVSIVAGGSVDLGGTVTATTGSLNVRAGYQEGYFGDAANGVTPYGGSIMVSGALSGYSGVNLQASAGTYSGLNGEVLQSTGSIGSDNGAVSIVGSGNVALSGSVTAYGGIYVAAGFDGGEGGYYGSAYGGNITLNSGSSVYGGGAGVTLHASNGGDNVGGNILQYGGSTIYSGSGSGIMIISAGNTTLNGTVSSGYAIGIGAGLDPFDWGYSSSGLGGDITFGSGSIIRARNGVEGSAIKAVTRGGSLNIGGNIKQEAGSQFILDSYGDVQVLAYGDAQMDGATSIANAGGGYGIYVAAGGYNSGGVNSSFGVGVRAGSSNIVSIGSLSAVGGSAYVQAAGAILRSDGNSSGINITAGSVVLNSVYGGSSGGIAISAFTEATGSITANVNAGANNYGGISIQNFGAQPVTGIALIDNAANPGTGLSSENQLIPMSIAFRNSGNFALDSTTTFSTGNSGDVAITSGGSLDYSYAESLNVGGNNILLAAGGDLTMSSGLKATGNLKLGAGGILGVSSAIGGYNVELAAPVINVDADVSATNNAALIGATINLNAGVTADGTWTTRSNINGIEYSGIAFIAKDLVAYGPSAYLNATSATGDISALVSGNVTLDGGAHFMAGNNIDIVLSSAASTLSLSNGSYFLADYTTGIPATIALDFTSRSSGGVMIDGVETTKSVVGGSGFFEPDLSTPATPVVTYGVSSVAIDPCVANPGLCKISTPIDSPINQDPPPPPPPPPSSGSGPSTGLGGSTTGGGEGTFGAEPGGGTTGGTSGGTSDAGGTSGDKPPADDKKDDKDKKSDQAKDEKKDDKPAQKKVAQCS